MAKDYLWAMGPDGPEICKAKPENVGKGKCKHDRHYKSLKELQDNESLDFSAISDLDKYEKEQVEKEFEIKEQEISQEEINNLASKLDEIAGTRVTEENYEEVIKSLTPEQLDKLNKVGFEAASAFSLPVSDEMYDEINTSNKIYFSELPNYHIGGKVKAIQDMFGSIGPTPVQDGEYDIKSNYRDGLNPREYFEKQFSTRGSQIQKVVGMSKPGESARFAFYIMADTEVIDDCHNDESDGIMHCHAPGVCVKCAKKSGWDIKKGQLVGSIISTHLTEGLSQSTLKSIHISGENKSKADWEVIAATLKSTSGSSVIQKAKEAKTTEEARQIIFDGFKEHYDNAGIGIDDYNIQMYAKKLTSYKMGEDGRLRYVKPGEMCDFPSANAIGGHNNIFLQSELKYSYDKLTRPNTFESGRNSVTAMI